MTTIYTHAVAGLGIAALAMPRRLTARGGTATPKAICARMASLWAASVPSTSRAGSASA